MCTYCMWNILFSTKSNNIDSNWLTHTLKTKPSPAAPLPALPERSQDQTKPCCSSPCFTRTISRPNQALLLLSLLYQDDLKTKPSPAAPLPALPGRSQDQTKPCCSSPCFTRTISRPNQALLLLSLLYQDDLKTKPSPAAPLPALPGRSQDQTKPCCSSPCFTRTISRPNQALLLLSLLYQDDLKTKPSPAAPLPALPGRSQDQTKPCCSSPCFTRTISRPNQACCSSPCFTRTISRPNQALLLLSLLYQNDLKTKPSPAAPLPALPGRSQDQTKPCCSSPCFTRTISRPNQALLLLSLLYQDDLKTKPSPAAPLPALPGRSQD